MGILRRRFFGPAQNDAADVVRPKPAHDVPAAADLNDGFVGANELTLLDEVDVVSGKVAQRTHLTHYDLMDFLTFLSWYCLYVYVSIGIEGRAAGIKPVSFEPNNTQRVGTHVSFSSDGSGFSSQENGKETSNSPTQLASL